MYAAITNGFNLVFRWMGIWLACNIVTGALFRLDGWKKRRRVRKAMRLIPEGRRRVTAVVWETEIIVQGEDAPEADAEPDADSKRKTGEETEAGEESASEKAAPDTEAAVEP